MQPASAPSKELNPELAAYQDGFAYKPDPTFAALTHAPPATRGDGICSISPIELHVRMAAN